MLWKDTDSKDPPQEYKVITDFGLEFKDQFSLPVIAKGDPIPTKLFYVMSMLGSKS